MLDGPYSGACDNSSRGGSTRGGVVLMPFLWSQMVVFELITGVGLGHRSDGGQSVCLFDSMNLGNAGCVS